VPRCYWARCSYEPTSGSLLTAAESRTSQVRSQMRCIQTLRDDVMSTARRHLQDALGITLPGHIGGVFPASPGWVSW